MFLEAGQSSKPLEAKREELAARVLAARSALWAADLQARREWLADSDDDAASFAWNRSFAQLQEWHSRNGHCDVPIGHAAFPDLGGWVASQRAALRRGDLRPVQKHKLERLGFATCGAAEAAWQRHCDSLNEYLSANGHCDVPLHYSANPRLGMWLHQQRKYAASGLLEPHREAALRAIGALQPSGARGPQP